MAADEDEQAVLRSVALRNAQSILLVRSGLRRSLSGRRKLWS